jgi:CDP-4-dehydro-6-deoxyglucose reductase
MPSVTVQPDGVCVQLEDGETILAGLYRRGYAYRTGCRRGGCGICKVDLLEGAVDYERPVAPTVLSDDERESGICLSCRAVPNGDISIALRDDVLKCTMPLLAYIGRPKAPAPAHHPL